MWHSMFSSSGTEFSIRHIFFLLSHDLPFLVMHLTYLYPTYPRFWDAFPCCCVLIWPSPTLRSGLSYIHLLLKIRRTRPAFRISQKVAPLLHFRIKALSLFPNRRFPQPFHVSVFFILRQSFMATLFVITSIFTEANLATVPYYSYVPSHLSCIIRWTNLATVPYFTYHTRHLSGISASWWPIFPAFLALALTFLKETNFSHRHWHCSSSHYKLSLGPFHGHFHDAIPRDSVFAWTCHLASCIPYQWSHVERGSFFLVISNLFILVLVCFRYVC